jgi:HK97 family phage major capsid protein
MAKKTDQIVFIGDGSSTYGNIVGIGPKLQDIDGAGTDSAGLKAFSGHDAYSEVTAADLDALMGLLPEYADAEAEWYCHRKALFGILYRLERAAGGVTAAEMEGRRRLLYGGYPINVTQVMSSSEADEAIALIFGALSQGVTLGDRGQFSIKRSEHYKFAEGLVTVRGKMRLAINIHGCGTSSVAGPLVAGELETST